MIKFATGFFAGVAAAITIIALIALWTANSLIEISEGGDE